MIPTTGQQRKGASDDIGKDVEGIKVAAVGQKRLDDFGADGESGSADQQGQVNNAATGHLKDPVEGKLHWTVSRSVVLCKAVFGGMAYR